MKYIILIIIILLVVSNILADTPIGLTLRMRGNISLTRKEQTNPLTVGQNLINEDVLRSYDESFAVVKFVDDGATLRLFENSILTLSTEKERDKLQKSAFLQVGNVFTNVRSNRGDLSIETPTTVASVKGTEGFVIVHPDGSTYVIVIKGSYDVQNKQSRRTISVTAGNTAKSDEAGNLDSYETTDLDQELLDSVADITGQDIDIIKIELIREDGEKKTVEIEVE